MNYSDENDEFNDDLINEEEESSQFSCRICGKIYKEQVICCDEETEELSEFE